MGMPGGTPSNPITHEQTSFAFHEYEMVAEDTAKITDRRQTVNTLFVSINALFLTGVGYLIYTFFQTNGDGSHIVYYALGFLAIAIITTRINSSWLRLSEQSKNLINLRIRYLECLENLLRETNFFPTVDVPLTSNPELYEAAPKTLSDAEVSHQDAAGETQRWMRIRGTYSLETVLYNNPNPKFKVFGFTQAEQTVGKAFTGAYWAAFILSLLAIAIELFSFYVFNLHFIVGPFHF